MPAETKMASRKFSAPDRLEFKPKTKGYFPRFAALLAVLVIILMLAIVLGNIIYGGAGTIIVVL